MWVWWCLKVLSHRGRHWTLLQNVARDTWNAVHLARVVSHIPDKTSNDGADILSSDELKAVLCHPLCVVADCLVDMLTQAENHLFQVL